MMVYDDDGRAVEQIYATGTGEELAVVIRAAGRLVLAHDLRERWGALEAMSVESGRACVRSTVVKT